MFSIKDLVIVTFVVGVAVLIELRLIQFEQLHADIILIQKTAQEYIRRTQNLVNYASCKEYFDDGEKQDGIYTVSPDYKTKFDVYCDMKNGGWTVIQRRINGVVDFDRGWDEYANGFGDLMADHWLGLHFIHLLTKSPKQISFEIMMTSSKQTAKAVYHDFHVLDANSKFKMRVSPNVQYNKEMAKYTTNESSLNEFYRLNGKEFSLKHLHYEMSPLFVPVYPCAWWSQDCVKFGCINSKFDKMFIVYESEKEEDCDESDDDCVEYFSWCIYDERDVFLYQVPVSTSEVKIR